MAQRRSKVGNSKKGKHSGDIALAICYELSVPEHAENAFKSGAEIYIASVAKSVNGVDQAIKRLSDIASKYSMTVLMSNCVGQADGEECGGKTSIWNNKGLLVGQLDDTNEGIIVIDSDTQEVIEKTLYDNCHFAHQRCGPDAGAEAAPNLA